jgi:hypothetical protein
MGMQEMNFTLYITDDWKTYPMQQKWSISRKQCSYIAPGNSMFPTWSEVL